MFLSLSQVRRALRRLEGTHPFYVVTYLVCKNAELPIGDKSHIEIAGREDAFLERYYNPYEASPYYYAVWGVGWGKHWVRKRQYASSTLQKMRTTTFKDAFLHDVGTDLWGWQTGYVEAMADYLDSHNLPRIPAFDLAVWLYRDQEWSAGTRPADVVDRLLKQFHIAPEEEVTLFDSSLPQSATRELLHQNEISIADLRGVIGRPPGEPPEEGGVLAYLGLEAVGPAKHMEFEPGERLSLVTGDNGLGKSFLLECAWWALSGHWAEHAAYPREDAVEARITFQVSAEGARAPRTTVSYDWDTRRWRAPRQRPIIPGLVVYARVDGSFAIWDPARHYWPQRSGGTAVPEAHPLVFKKNEVWDGMEEEVDGVQSVLANGLLRDWIRWQDRRETSPFDVLVAVLARLSPPAVGDIGSLAPGEPTRLPRDAREMPTLRHPYGDVPIVYASAGIRRIVALAYLIVWAWSEHQTQSEMLRRRPERRMVVLVDEMEAHLHPQWQRVILPALLDVHGCLDSQLRAQLLIGTHSPLVLASVEPVFDEALDKVFHLDLPGDDGLPDDVVLEELPFFRYGTSDMWLTSDVFELHHARSVEAEEMIEEAKGLQLQDSPRQAEIERVSEALLRLLSPNDQFWPRWKYFAEEHGVEL